MPRNFIFCRRNRAWLEIIVGVLFLAAASAMAQDSVSNAPTAETNKSASNFDTTFQHEQEVRAACINGRRRICGKILEVLPEGLIVESGYTNLMREPLTKSWLVSGTVTAGRPENLIEGKTPGAFCVGLVLLTNPPKSKNLRPAKYDYLIIEGYPAGQYAYTSTGAVHRTIRRFSADLTDAVRVNLEAEPKSESSNPQVK